MFLDWKPHITTLDIQGSSNISFTTTDPHGVPITASANYSDTFTRATMQDLNKYPFTSGFGGLDYWSGGIPFTSFPLPFTFVLWCDQLAPYQTLTYLSTPYFNSSVGIAIPPDYHPVIGTATNGDDTSDITFERIILSI